ncbi:winged helix-turn-helix transcriptional regulator [Crossiella sp. CA198]|uniref:winged helix-turn-helix transcriptional regulator n=1 Tax=Crossiella sp. CA198 TaxID=3455607 RepID=UPI003F8D247D
MEIIDGRWKPVILAHLKEGVHHYGEPRRRMPGVSEKTLTRQLRQLEAAGLVRRESLGGKAPHVEYRLTAEGDAPGPALTAPHAWAADRAAGRGIAFEPLP